MSRIGKQPIEIPSGVTLAIDGRAVGIKGPKGELSVTLPPKVSIEQKEQELVVSVSDTTQARLAAFWGLGRTLVSNAILGVTEGFSKKLEVNGVGYKVQLNGKTLVLNVGYSHPVEFDIPEGIEASVEGNTITISGIDKQLVGEIASQIRRVRKPEPYKGKGIKYSDEIIRRKEGKVLKGAEGAA
jgi:large subunit ribosomal protein L6